MSDLIEIIFSFILNPKLMLSSAVGFLLFLILNGLLPESEWGFWLAASMGLACVIGGIIWECRSGSDS